MTLKLFEAYGIELEYVLVDARTLDVLPVADAVLRDASGEVVADLEHGDIAWSNELVLHLLELKTNGPVARLEGVAAAFERELQRLRAALQPLGGRLMATGMHPWMDPRRETRLWPHEYAAVYENFDRIFGCRAHGWANVQSVHLNLPFAGDAEFGRLHAAIRLVLPLVPALAASSPFVDGAASGVLDTRLAVYGSNSARLPSITGAVIPEPVFTRAAYETEILERIGHDLTGLDPGGMMQPEWVNARGAIARFERSSIEIRLLDMQECPRADVACVALVTAAVRALAEERWVSMESLQAWPTGSLAALLQATIRDGERARIDDSAYLAVFGRQGAGGSTAGDLWRHVAETVLSAPPELEPALAVLLERGPLARRLLDAVGATPSRIRLYDVYQQLCDCLDRGALFA